LSASSGTLSNQELRFGLPARYGIGSRNEHVPVIRNP
jgi:hypothetical protein